MPTITGRNFAARQRAGVSEAKQVPTEWAKDKNIAWQVDLPGVAWSQPIVWGDKIFVTTAITENQQKPRAGGGGFGGPGGPGGGRRGGFGPPDGGFGPDGLPRGPRDDAPEREQPREPAQKDDTAQEKAPPQRDAGDRPGEGGGPRRGGFGPGGPGRGGRGGFGPGGMGGGEPPNAIYQWKVLCLDAANGNVVWERLRMKENRAWRFSLLTATPRRRQSPTASACTHTLV